MVEIFGSVTESEIVDGQEQMTFRIPALSESLAKRRARFNARVKGLRNAEVISQEAIEEGQIPGQRIFSITLKAPR